MGSDKTGAERLEATVMGMTASILLAGIIVLFTAADGPPEPKRKSRRARRETSTAEPDRADDIAKAALELLRRDRDLDDDTFTPPGAIGQAIDRDRRKNRAR